MRRSWFIAAVALLGLAGCIAPQVESTTWKPAVVRSAAPADDDPLALAAACLERGDDAAAVEPLADYVRHHPRSLTVRSYLAELHFKLGRFDEARLHFERCLAIAGHGDGARTQCIHGHTRLMELAEADGRTADEERHRGLGLLLLVRGWTGADRVELEAALSKAVRCLRASLDDQPDDARCWLGLADAYERLGQFAAMRQALRRVERLLPMSSDVDGDRRSRLLGD